MLGKPELWSRADLNPHVKAIFDMENLKNINSALSNQVNVQLTNLHMVFPFLGLFLCHLTLDTTPEADGPHGIPLKSTDKSKCTFL